MDGEVAPVAGLDAVDLAGRGASAPGLGKTGWRGPGRLLDVAAWDLSFRELGRQDWRDKQIDGLWPDGTLEGLLGGWAPIALEGGLRSRAQGRGAATHHSLVRLGGDRD